MPEVSVLGSVLLVAVAVVAAGVPAVLVAAAAPVPAVAATLPPLPWA